MLSLIFSLVIGFLLAALLDQKIRFEDTFRTIFLYPFALSFIVTGLVWQWMLNPDFGIQSVVRSLGWASFTFDPLYNPDIVIYGILIAGALAGHRPDHVPDARRPARHRRGHLEGGARRRHPDVEDLSLHRHPDDAAGLHHHAGHHRHRHRASVYDLVVAQTSGGPGIASEVPAKYVYDYMFQAQNLGQGFAASTMMLLIGRSSSSSRGPISNSDGGEAWLTPPLSTPLPPAVDGRRRHSAGPAAPRPRRALVAGATSSSTAR